MNANGGQSAFSFGPAIEPGGVRFRLWAPAAKSVELLHGGRLAMDRNDDGWFSLHVRDCRPGALYKFCIDEELEIPDPASAFQPHDVFGPSEVLDHHAFAWQADDWRGRRWEEAVLLELHAGAFTAGGTFRSAIDRLDHCVETGVTAIELMPVADFAGRWNWGYDGVLLYAPDSSYGRPEDLKALIDAAHQRELMVILDVVYNHFGPEGNFLPRYAPQFFCKAQTPWGSAVDYRIPEVRAFAIENALHWLELYRFDGLRLDAVHAIVEPGEPPLLHDLGKVVQALAVRSGREIHLVLENDDNAASLLAGESASGQEGLYRAQWNDDYHHAWHVLLTGETSGYYKDYAPDPLPTLARALGSGFSYQGEPSPHRGGRTRGEPSGLLPTTAFVNFLQNHDQIGNRALGDRLGTLADPRAIEAALAITLLAPMTPLLFMGEEWGSLRPFPFFCDFQGELADAVRRGRRAEFSEAYEALGDEVPDPLAEETFRSAQPDWDSLEHETERARWQWVRELLELRATEVVPRLRGARFGGCRIASRIVRSQWTMGDGQELHLLANLSDEPSECNEPILGQIIHGGRRSSSLSPWGVFWSLSKRP